MNNREKALGRFEGKDQYKNSAIVHREKMMKK